MEVSRSSSLHHLCLCILSIKFINGADQKLILSSQQIQKDKLPFPRPDYKRVFLLFYFFNNIIKKIHLNTQSFP